MIPMPGLLTTSIENNVLQRLIDVRVAKFKTGFQQTAGNHALALEPHITKFTQNQPDHKSQYRHKRGPVQYFSNRTSQILVSQGIGRTKIYSAGYIFMAKQKYKRGGKAETPPAYSEYFEKADNDTNKVSQWIQTILFALADSWQNFVHFKIHEKPGFALVFILHSLVLFPANLVNQRTVFFFTGIGEV